MQSQFYAGDSGSVSHKNVDQTTTSRRRVLERFSNVRFVEYVDGAGYFSSLNGDLKKLLNMSDTHSFTQIRSAPIRLRRELQALGFVTPLEIEHAIVRTSGRKDAVAEQLVEDGYRAEEVARAAKRAQASGIITEAANKFEIREERRSIVRQYLLLDTVANFGREMTPGSSTSGACVLVPGYGPFYGLEFDELVQQASSLAGTLQADINQSQVFASDLKALAQLGFTMVR